MKYSELDNWIDGFQDDSLLFFTQRVNEMLFHFTDHVFQTPVYNTALLVDEFLDNQGLVEEGTIGSKHLKHIMDEFLSSFKNDIVLNRHIDKAEKRDLLREINTPPLTERRVIMEYVKAVLDDYIAWSKIMLKEAIFQKKEKKEIDQVLRCFIPGLISSGYSHEFIYHHNIDVFYSKPVNSLEALDSFLDRFDFRKREYKVFMAIKVCSDAFQHFLEEQLNIDFGPFDENVSINYRKKEYKLVKLSLEALDDYSAAKNAYSVLNSIYKYYCFFAEQDTDWFVSQAKVVNQDGKMTTAMLKDYGLSHAKGRKRETVADQLDFFVSSPTTHNNARDQINRALDLHNTAIKDSDITNRFLNFWSTLEILFVTKQNEAKLTEVINKIIPILQKDYLYYLFAYIQTETNKLCHRMGRYDFADYVEENEKEYWVLFVAIFDKYSKQREELFSLLTKYPLLRYRIEQLNELSRDKTNLLDAVKKHTQRVTWHIIRLYRTRNTIVHSGKYQNNLMELLEHLHSYSDQVLLEIVYLLSAKPGLVSVANAIFDTQRRANKILRILQDHSQICVLDILTIMDN